MKRRELIIMFLAGMALAGPCVARAQPMPTVPHISYLWLGPAGTDGPTRAGLQQGLRELGYVEGRNLIVDYRYANGKEERLNGLVAEIVGGKVDIIVSVGTIVTRAVKKATATIPVVSATGDAVGSGLVASLARPGGNITGVTITPGPEVAEKWLELLHEAITDASRVAVLWNSSSSASTANLQRMRRVAGNLGLTLLSHEVRSPTDFPIAFDAIVKERADAVVIDQDPLLSSYQSSIIEFAAARRLPAIYGLRDFVAADGLMSYDASIFEIWRRAASYIDRILKGAKPGDLPIEQPTKFDLVINLKTAKALGLTIPPTLLARADEVIE
jgi:putative tryptophan/tyrosine transport system substrate-binding protein